MQRNMLTLALLAICLGMATAQVVPVPLQLPEFKMPAKPGLNYILNSLVTLKMPKTLLQELPDWLPEGSAPKKLVDMTTVQGDLLLSVQLYQLRTAAQAKLAADTAKLAAITAGTDASVADCKVLDKSTAAACIALKAKPLKAGLDGASSGVSSLADFEKQLNFDILSLFAKYPTKTCDVLTMSNAAASKLSALDKGQAALVKKTADLKKGAIKSSKFWSLPAGKKAPAKASMGLPCAA